MSVFKKKVGKMTLDVFHNFRSAGEALPMHRTLNYNFLMRYLKDLFLVRNRNAFVLAQTQGFLDEGIGLLPRLQIKMYCSSSSWEAGVFLCSLRLCFSLFLFFSVSLFLCRAVIGLLVYTSSSEKNYHDLCPKYDHAGDRIFLDWLRSVHSFVALI